jgi:hypothetical protein
MARRTNYAVDVGILHPFGEKGKQVEEGVFEAERGDKINPKILAFRF